MVMSGTDTVSHSARSAVQNVDELLRLHWADLGSGNILAVEEPARNSVKFCGCGACRPSLWRSCRGRLNTLTAHAWSWPHTSGEVPRCEGRLAMSQNATRKSAVRSWRLSLTVPYRSFGKTGLQPDFSLRFLSAFSFSWKACLTSRSPCGVILLILNYECIQFDVLICFNYHVS